jgi:hypothetical protein
MLFGNLMIASFLGIKNFATNKKAPVPRLLSAQGFVSLMMACSAI